MKLTKQYLKQIILEELNKVIEGNVIDASSRFSKSSPPSNEPSTDDTPDTANVTNISEKQLLNKIRKLANDLQNIPKKTEEQLKDRIKKVEEIFSVAQEIQKEFKKSSDKISLFDSFIKLFPTNLWPTAEEYAGYDFDNRKTPSEKNDTLDIPQVVTAIVIKNAGVASKSIYPLVQIPYGKYIKSTTPKRGRAPQYDPRYSDEPWYKGR